MKVLLKDIRKSFGQNLVLDGVNLSMTDGEVIAIAGENGAGKSTLMKILSGAESMDSGHLEIEGREVHFHSPQDAMSYKISMIYQEMNLVRDLTVAENMFLADRDKTYGSAHVNRRKMMSDARTVLQGMGLSLDPSADVGSLSVAEQQLIEICKSLIKDTRLLIMDEPTAALNKEEIARLFDQIKRLKESGMTVIYITHRLEEIFELADRVAILRDGQVTLESKTGDVDYDNLVLAMVGKQIANFYPKERNAKMDETILQLSDVTCAPRFSHVSLSVHAGEVLGLAGLMGSGASDVLRCVFGDLGPYTGAMKLNGAEYSVRHPLDAINAGVGFLTADRKQEGLLMEMSINDNLSLVSLKRFTGSLRAVDTRRERAETESYMHQVAIRSDRVRTNVSSLSGGNQQKVVFGKWMMAQPRLFLMEEPTRGVDVGAKTEIYGLMNELTRSGVAILLVSSDIPEMVAMADNVLIFRGGSVREELTGDDITQRNLLDYSLRGDHDA